MDTGDIAALSRHIASGGNPHDLCDVPYALWEATWDNIWPVVKLLAAYNTPSGNADCIELAIAHSSSACVPWLIPHADVTRSNSLLLQQAGWAHEYEIFDLLYSVCDPIAALADQMASSHTNDPNDWALLEQRIADERLRSALQPLLDNTNKERRKM